MKERIIAYALVLFRQYGIKGVRMDDIASGTGISKRTLYEHFISKDELLDECLYVRLEEQRLLISTAGNLIDELLVLYTTIQSLDLKSILRFCLELQRFYKPLYRMLLVRLSDYAAACSEKVSSGINEGYLRPDTTPFLVRTVVCEYLDLLFAHAGGECEKIWNGVPPEIILVFTRGLCTIKGRAYLDRKLKEIA